MQSQALDRLRRPGEIEAIRVILVRDIYRHGRDDMVSMCCAELG